MTCQASEADGLVDASAAEKSALTTLISELGCAMRSVVRFFFFWAFQPIRTFDSKTKTTRSGGNVVQGATGTRSACSPDDAIARLAVRGLTFDTGGCPLT